MEKYICAIKDNNVQSVAVKPIIIVELDCYYSDIVKKTKEIVGVLNGKIDLF